MPRISKTVSSFNELGTADKRLVGKLVKMLAENQLDGTARSKVTRLLRKIHNPAGAAVASKTKRANGYVEFYKARFQDVRDNNKGVPMTDLAKVIGAEWQRRRWTRGKRTHTASAPPSPAKQGRRPRIKVNSEMARRVYEKNNNRSEKDVRYM